MFMAVLFLPPNTLIRIYLRWTRSAQLYLNCLSGVPCEHIIEQLIIMNGFCEKGTIKNYYFSGGIINSILFNFEIFLN